MKFPLLIFIFLFSMVSNAQEIRPPEPEVPQKVQYQCDVEGGDSFFISTELEKVWTGEPDMASDGKYIPLIKKSWQTFRCPHCYTMEFLLPLYGMTLNFNLKLSAKQEAISLDIVSFDADDIENREESTMTCKFVSDRVTSKPQLDLRAKAFEYAKLIAQSIGTTVDERCIAGSALSEEEEQQFPKMEAYYIPFGKMDQYGECEGHDSAVEVYMHGNGKLYKLQIIDM